VKPGVRRQAAVGGEGALRQFVQTDGKLGRLDAVLVVVRLFTSRRAALQVAAAVSGCRTWSK
jgi:hypothetical protein